MSAIHGQHRICPLVAKPDPECLCLNLTSQRIIDVVAFCCDRFESCVIYRRQSPAAVEDKAASSVEIQANTKGVDR